MYMRAISRVTAQMRAGDNTLFNAYWNRYMYSRGSWPKTPVCNIIVLIDGISLKALHSEYHPLGDDGVPANWTIAVPELFLGKTPESIDFIQKQIELHSNISNTGVLGSVVNVGNNTFMIGVGPVMASKFDTNAAAYIVWGVELGSRLPNFSWSKHLFSCFHRFEFIRFSLGNGLCVSIWYSKEDLPKDYKEVVDTFGDNTPYSTNDTEYLVLKHIGHIVYGKNSRRTCPSNVNLGWTKTYEYFKLGQGKQENKTYIRLERERVIENSSNTASGIMGAMLLGLFVFDLIVILVYLEFIILKRLEIIRASIARLSAMSGYDSAGSASEDDEFGVDPFAEDKATHETGGDEIGNLRFLAKMQVESLRRRYTDTVAKLRVERVVNDHIYDVISLMSLTKERKDKRFIRVHLPKAVCTDGLTIHHVFTCPVTLEFFKDYCSGVGKFSYIFFFLDIMWLRTIEATAAGTSSNKRKQQQIGAAVAAAKMIGQKYILRKGSSYIELKKETRQKIVSMESYSVGMYDEAYEEVLEILNGLLVDFGKSHQYKEATVILSIKAGDPEL